MWSEGGVVKEIRCLGDKRSISLGNSLVLTSDIYTEWNPCTDHPDLCAGEHFIMTTFMRRKHC